jgi:hypothetical protein
MSIRLSEKNISAGNAPKNEWTKGRIGLKMRTTEQTDKLATVEPKKTPDPFTSPVCNRFPLPWLFSFCHSKAMRGRNMAIRKTPQRMTKKEFLKMVDELQR